MKGSTSTVVFEVRTTIAHVETVVVAVARRVVRVHYDRVEVRLRHLEDHNEDYDGDEEGDDDYDGDGDDVGDDDGVEVTPHSGSLPSQHFFASLQLPISPTASSAKITRSKPQMADFEFILDSSLRRLLCTLHNQTVVLGGWVGLPRPSTLLQLTAHWHQQPLLIVVRSAHAELHASHNISHFRTSCLASVFGAVHSPTKCASWK